LWILSSALEQLERFRKLKEKLFKYIARFKNTSDDSSQGTVSKLRELLSKMMREMAGFHFETNANKLSKMM